MCRRCSICYQSRLWSVGNASLVIFNNSFNSNLLSLWDHYVSEVLYREGLPSITCLSLRSAHPDSCFSLVVTLFSVWVWRLYRYLSNTLRSDRCHVFKVTKEVCQKRDLGVEYQGWNLPSEPEPVSLCQPKSVSDWAWCSLSSVCLSVSVRPCPPWTCPSIWAWPCLCLSLSEPESVFIDRKQL